MTDVSSIPIRDFLDGETIRLISTAYIEQPALAPLADTDAELAILEQLEGLSSARTPQFGSLPDAVDPSELLGPASGYGWTMINAAFCYTRETGNRFSGAERGAWYAAWGDGADLTAQAEVSWHLSRELEYIGIFDNTTAYRELIAGFVTQFYDLRQFEDAEFLGSDPRSAYPAGQNLGREIFSRGGNGVLYPSARRGQGTCLAAFRPHLIQNLRQGRRWVFRWSESKDPTISLN